MTPYYEDEHSTIYCGDCRDILPHLGPVDLVLTDPPYGIKVNTDSSRFSGGSNPDWRRRMWGRGSAPIVGDDTSFEPAFLLSYGKNQIIFGWNHFPDKLPRGGCLVWVKRRDDMFGSFLSDAEIAWVSNRHGVYCWRGLPNWINIGRYHPTEKPVALMRWCIEKVKETQIILDPFMGSGTTLLAAKQLGRKAIGIEISEAYCKIAVERLRQEVLPFTPRVTPTQQQDTLWNGTAK